MDEGIICVQVGSVKAFLAHFQPKTIDFALGLRYNAMNFIILPNLYNLETHYAEKL
jgi:hypothetical protein